MISRAVRIKNGCIMSLPSGASRRLMGGLAGAWRSTTRSRLPPVLL
jgi:hypothetical protein